jgi:hypothetical protein
MLPAVKCDMPDTYCYCPAAAGNKNLCSFRFIDNARNFIYYDVPKAGSSSIRETLFPDSWPYHNVLEPCKYSVKAAFVIDKDYKTFSFVRNPYARMVSAYFHFSKHGIIKDYESLSKAFNIELEEIDTFKGFVKMTTIHQNHHWQPQVTHIPSSINFIGKIESFQKDFDALCRLLNIRRRIIPRSNKTRHKHYSVYYDDETYNIVTERYSEDLQRFNYTFDRFDYV